VASFGEAPEFELDVAVTTVGGENIPTKLDTAHICVSHVQRLLHQTHSRRQKVLTLSVSAPLLSPPRSCSAGNSETHEHLGA
jgi:hypothetical protein